MKLKNIEGLLPMPQEGKHILVETAKLGEKELEIDVERVYLTMKQFSEYYGMADENVRKIAQVIAKEFPIKVKEVEE